MNDSIREAIDRLRRVNAGELLDAVYPSDLPTNFSRFEYAKSQLQVDQENVADYYISILDREQAND
jgi:hypothetical protein